MPSSTLVAMGIGLFLLYEPVKKLSAVQLQLQESLSAAERVFQVLDQTPSVVESATARVLPPLLLLVMDPELSRMNSTSSGT